MSINSDLRALEAFVEKPGPGGAKIRPSEKRGRFLELEKRGLFRQMAHDLRVGIREGFHVDVAKDSVDPNYYAAKAEGIYRAVIGLFGHIYDRGTKPQREKLLKIINTIQEFPTNNPHPPNAIEKATGLRVMMLLNDYRISVEFKEHLERLLNPKPKTAPAAAVALPPAGLVKPRGRRRAVARVAPKFRKMSTISQGSTGYSDSKSISARRRLSSSSNYSSSSSSSSGGSSSSSASRRSGSSETSDVPHFVGIKKPWGRDRIKPLDKKDKRT